MDGQKVASFMEHYYFIGYQFKNPNALRNKKKKTIKLENFELEDPYMDNSIQWSETKIMQGPLYERQYNFQLPPIEAEPLITYLSTRDTRKRVHTFYILLLSIQIIFVILINILLKNDLLIDFKPESLLKLLLIVLAFSSYGITQRNCSQSTLSYSLLVFMISFQLYLILHVVFSISNYGRQQLSFDMLKNALFCSCSNIIALSTLKGRIVPYQLVILSIFCTLGYCFLTKINNSIEAFDLGQNIQVHIYGSVFSVVAGSFLRETAVKEGRYGNSMFYMFFTMIIVCFYNEFLTNPSQTNQLKHQIYITSSISSFSSFIGSIAIIFILNKKMEKQLIQNSLFTGYIMISSLSYKFNLTIIISISFFAGCLLSVYYVYIHKYFTQRDQYGVLMVHGVIGVLSVLIGVFGTLEGWKEVIFLSFSLLTSISLGFVTGVLFEKQQVQSYNEAHYFTGYNFFHLPKKVFTKEKTSDIKINIHMPMLAEEDEYNNEYMFQTLNKNKVIMSQSVKSKTGDLGIFYDNQFDHFKYIRKDYQQENSKDGEIYTINEDNVIENISTSNNVQQNYYYQKSEDIKGSIQLENLTFQDVNTEQDLVESEVQKKSIKFSINQDTKRDSDPKKTQLEGSKTSQQSIIQSILIPSKTDQNTNKIPQKIQLTDVKEAIVSNQSSNVLYNDIQSSSGDPNPSYVDSFGIIDTDRPLTISKIEKI